MNKTAVVIPNYNGIKYNSDCLNSLRKQSVKDFDVIVVDNGSTDGSMEEILCNFSWVKCVQRVENGGFSVAVNEGIRKAREDGAEYIILLNNDTVADEYFVERMVQAMEAHPEAFSVQAKMLSMSNPDVIDDAGDFYTVLGWAYARGKGKPASKYDKPCQIFASCAGAAIYRGEVFDIIGYFDELHFAYLEDIDIGYRSKLYGYANWYEPKAVIYHAGSGSSGSRYNEFKIRLAARNSILLVYKNQTLLQKVLHFCPLATGVIIKQIFFALKGNGFGSIYHKAILEGLKLCRTEDVRMRKLQKSAVKCRNVCKIEYELWINAIKKLFV